MALRVFFKVKEMFNFFRRGVGCAFDFRFKYRQVTHNLFQRFNRQVFVCFGKADANQGSHNQRTERFRSSHACCGQRYQV
jgi:hypothetical protein